MGDGEQEEAVTLVKGKSLTPVLRREVLAAFVHRHLTAQVWPADDSWLEGHAFYVTKTGQLARRPRHCEPAFMADPLGPVVSGTRGMLPGERQ